MLSVLPNHLNCCFFLRRTQHVVALLPKLVLYKCPFKSALFLQHTPVAVTSSTTHGKPSKEYTIPQSFHLSRLPFSHKKTPQRCLAATTGQFDLFSKPIHQNFFLTHRSPIQSPKINTLFKHESHWSLLREIGALLIHYRCDRSSTPLLKVIKFTFRTLLWQVLKANTNNHPTLPIKTTLPLQ